MSTLAFGPMRYRMEGPVPADLEVFVQPGDGGDAPAVAVDPLADQVVRDAPALGAVVLHAAGIRVEGGVVALVAPPGTGKTTAAVNAGARGFAYNGMLARAVTADASGAVEVWALPFAGGMPPPPPVRDAGRQVLRAVLRLDRTDAPEFEWIRGVDATTVLLRACVRPRNGDPHAMRRAVLALDIAGRVRVGRLAVPMSPGWLDTLDSGLKGP